MTQRSLFRMVLPAAVAAICAASAEQAEAQSQSLFGNRGPSSQIGSNLTGSRVGNTTTFGSSSGTFGLSGQTLGSTMGGTTGGLGAAGQQGAFVGRDDTAGRFVGDQRLGQQTTGGRGQTGRGGTNQFGGGNRRGGGVTGQAFGDTGDSNGRGQNSSRRVIRPRQEVAFSYTPREVTTVNTALRTNFDRLAVRRPAVFADITLTINDEGIVTLSGEVDTVESSRLAAIMARLEPGVRSVNNELTIATAVRAN